MTFTIRVTKRRALLLGLPLLLIAAVAVAAWVVNGTGGGTAKSGTLVAPTVSTATAPSGPSDLYAGSTGTLYLSVTNTNPVDLQLTDIAAKAQVTPTCQTTCTGCTPLTNILSIPAKTGLSILIPKNATTVVQVPNGISMQNFAPSACQGVTFNTAGTDVVASFTT